MKVLTIILIALLAASGRFAGDLRRAETRSLFEFIGADEDAAPVKMIISAEYGMGRPITIYDAELVARMYAAVQNITVLEATDERVTDSYTYVKFVCADDTEINVSFEAGNLDFGGECYIIDGDADFWRTYYLAIDATCEYYFDDADMRVLRRYAWDADEKLMRLGDIECADAAVILPAIDAFMDLTILREIAAPETEGEALEFAMPDGRFMKITLWENALAYGGACYEVSGMPALFEALNALR